MRLLTAVAVVGTKFAQLGVPVAVPLLISFLVIFNAGHN